MAENHTELTLNSEEATRRFGARLGAVLRPGDTVLLSGDIGAGKTFLARALIQSMQDHPEDVPSPTFTLVQTYEMPNGELWHSDLYRLGGTDEIEELGLIDAFDTAICLVEWPDRLGPLWPRDALHLTLEAPALDSKLTDSRKITLAWTDPKWDGLIPILTKEVA